MYTKLLTRKGLRKVLITSLIFSIITNLAYIKLTADIDKLIGYRFILGLTFPFDALARVILIDKNRGRYNQSTFHKSNFSTLMGIALSYAAMNKSIFDVNAATSDFVLSPPVLSSIVSLILLALVTSNLIKVREVFTQLTD